MTWGDRTVFTFKHGDIPNPDLRWERTRTYDLGLDFSFMDHRFTGSVDIYQSNTFDLLMERLLPATSGYETALENVGQVRNQGLEVTLSSINIHSADFMWSTDLIFATNRNEIIDLFGEKEDDPGSGWFIGESMNAIHFWDRIGVWQLDEAEEAAAYGFRPGDIKFRDVTGDGSIGGTYRRGVQRRRRHRR
jgi:hypothetical protein